MLNRIIIPYQQYIKPYHHTIPAYTRARDERRWLSVKRTRAHAFRAIQMYQHHKKTQCIDIMLLHQHHKYTRACHGSVDIVLLNQKDCWGSLILWRAMAERQVHKSDRAGTSMDRASSAQECILRMPSGRQGRNEYGYHTAVPTLPVHKKSMRARDE